MRGGPDLKETWVETWFVGINRCRALLEAAAASLILLSFGFCAGISSSAAADSYKDPHNDPHSDDRCARKSPHEKSIVVAAKKAAEGEGPFFIVTDEDDQPTLALQPIAKVSEYVPDLAEPMEPTLADLLVEASNNQLSEAKTTSSKPRLAKSTAPIEPEAISFHGITPGISKRINVLRTWGDPRSDDTQASTLLYRFDNLAVEVNFARNLVDSIAVKLQQPLTIAALTRKLDLGQMRAATVTDDTGAATSQLFPERGVVLHFTQQQQGIAIASDDRQLTEEHAGPYVNRIAIQPITAQPFLLRANESSTTDLTSTIADLETALRIDRTLAEPRDHLSEIYLLIGKAVTAERYSAEAVELQPGNPRYRLQRAKCLRHLARYDRAVEEARQVLETPGITPLVRAQTLNEMGLLVALGPQKVARRAMPLHSKAIEIADRLTLSDDPQLSQQAQELLVEAHLAIAVEISQGAWRGKDEAVPQWIERASALAEAAIDEDPTNLPLRLQVAVSALAAASNLDEPINPLLWIEEAEETAAEIQQGISDLLSLGQYDWLLGLAYFHGSQIEHRRSKPDSALQLGERAEQQLSELAKGRDELPDTSYLMGRLYFQIGAIHAVHYENHADACAWYDEAVDRLLNPVPVTTMANPQQHGDALVSMGVSFWDQQQRTRAIAVTESGLELIEQAVSSGLLEAKSLLIPYNNLVAMYQAQGETAPAARYQKLAKKITGNQKSTGNKVSQKPRQLPRKHRR